jgi:hypothetical protein
MYKKTITLAALALIAGSTAFSNTPLITNTTFENFDGWTFGSNRFQPKDTWQVFVTAPDAYAFEDRLAILGGGEYAYTNWDDGIADKIESFMFNEFGAGPVGSGFDSIFQTGDVIRFTGTASAVRTGPDTSDMNVRAFIKVLGYNELGWAFQVKQEYTVFHDITSATESFDLTVTFPDLEVDDSLQVLQIGFEVTGEFNVGDTAIDTATITFSDIAGYIEGTGGASWAGFPVGDQGYVDTGSWMGFLYVQQPPYVYNVFLNNWMYIPEESVTENGAWTYIVNPAAPAAN